MIYTELTQNTFCDELSKDESNGFSYKGSEIIYEYLQDIGEDIEFDPIDIRSNYNEYNIEEYLSDYKSIQEEYKQYGEDNKLEDCEETREDFFNEHIKNNEYFIGGFSKCFLVINH